MDKKEEAPIVESTQSDTPVESPNESLVNNETLSALKDIIKQTVSEVLAASETEKSRKQAEEYNAKVADLVSNTQAKIIKPNLDNEQRHIEYVTKVIKEDARMRLQSSDGRARYGESTEDFTKAKIVLLKKMGLQEAEIARELSDLLQ